MIDHHPLLVVAVAYVALVAVVVKLDAGVLIVALVPLATAFFTYFLAKKQREDIRRETARIAVAAAAAQEQVRSKVDEVHVLVNSQKDALENALAERDQRIEQLEKMLTKKVTP